MWRKKKVRPEVAAAITTALVAGGLMGAGDKIAGIYQKRQESLWRQVGLVELMNSRNISNSFGL
jgi:hypothetical protein